MLNRFLAGVLDFKSGEKFDYIWIDWLSLSLEFELRAKLYKEFYCLLERKSSVDSA